MNVDRMLQLEAAKKAEDARRAAALAPTGLMSKLPAPVQAAGRFIGGAGQAGVTPYLGRAVAGGGAGYQAVDAYNRFQQGDYPGAAISGVGALSSAASLIPTPVTRVGGAGLGIGAEMLNQYLDSLKQKTNAMGQPQQPQPMPQMAKGGLVGYAPGGSVMPNVSIDARNIPSMSGAPGVGYMQTPQGVMARLQMEKELEQARIRAGISGVAMALPGQQGVQTMPGQMDIGVNMPIGPGRLDISANRSINPVPGKGHMQGANARYTIPFKKGGLS